MTGYTQSDMYSVLFYGMKDTDPRPPSTTFPLLLGWAPVSEKSAEVVAPEKMRLPNWSSLVKAGLVPRPDTLMELLYAEERP